jgi:hypothetical protein
MCDVHNPILCIIPPYMLEKMVERGTEKIRAAALKAIKQSNHLRSLRSLIQEQPRTDRESLIPGVDAHSCKLTRRVYDAKNGETLPMILLWMRRMTGLEIHGTSTMVCMSGVL